jgi:Phage integrase, N-terminal SAM-like domain
MTTAAPSTALATIQPIFTDSERLALAGFLAGYRGLTREAYALDLRQFTTWCRARSLPLFAVRRADIESFARELEVRGRARATVTRRLCTIAGFYKSAVEEELLEHSPAAHVRRPPPALGEKPCERHGRRGQRRQRALGGERCERRRPRGRSCRRPPLRDDLEPARVVEADADCSVRPSAPPIDSRPILGLRRAIRLVMVCPVRAHVVYA